MRFLAGSVNGHEEEDALSDDYDFNVDRPDDHDLIKDRRVPADRRDARAYTHWREILRTPAPEVLAGRPGVQVSRYPLTHPWWPFQGHPDNTDRHYDDHCDMFGEIPDYLPSRARGYRGKRRTREEG